ncbi:MAG: type IV secretion system protein TraC [Pseudomonadota bacterium]
MHADPLGLLNRVGAALTGEGSMFDRIRQETSLDRLSEMLPYRLYDDEHGLYLNANSTGWILEIVPLLGADDTVVNVLSEMFSDGIPDHAHLQIITWASPRVGPVLDAWATARGGEAGVFKKLALHRVAHLRAGAFDSLSREAPFLTRQFRVFLALGVEGSATEEIREQLADLKANVAQGLKSLGVASRNVTPDGLIRVLDDILNPQRAVSRSEAIYDRAELIDRQIVRPDTKVRVEGDRLLFETVAAEDHSPFANATAPGLENYKTACFDVRAFSARKFPEAFHQAEMATAIGHPMTKQLRLPCPVLSCLAIAFGSKDGSSDLVGAKFGRAEQQAATNMVRFLPELKDKADDWKWVRERVRDGARLVRAGYFLMAFAPEGEGEAAERALRSLYKNMGWELSKDRFVGSQTLNACLPLALADGLGEDLQKMRRLRFMVTDTCVQVAPLQGEYLGGNRPDLMLVGRRGQPFFWSPFANEGSGNHNVSIIGSSGSGKSVLMQELVTGLRGAGAAVVVIDDGESSKHTCEGLKGAHIKFTLQNRIGLNPFALLDERMAAKDQDYKAESLTLVRAMIEQMAKGEERASAEERGLIDGAVSEVWTAKGANAGVDDVAKALRKTTKTEDAPGVKLANALKPYTSAGLYGAFFNGEATLAIDNPLTVFEMKDLEGKTELRAIVMLALMFLINQRMMRDRREKMALVIDEAWALLGKGAAGDFIAGFARRCRKYGGAIITGTQGIDDYYATDGAQAAFENSDWTILLRMKPEPLAQVLKNERLSIDEATADVIRSLTVADGEYSELLIMGPRGRHVGRLVLDPFSATLFSSSADKFAEIERLEQMGLAVEDAVECVAFGRSPNDFVQNEARHAAE